MNTHRKKAPRWLARVTIVGLVLVVGVAIWLYVKGDQIDKAADVAKTLPAHPSSSLVASVVPSSPPSSRIETSPPMTVSSTPSRVPAPTTVTSQSSKSTAPSRTTVKTSSVTSPTLRPVSQSGLTPWKLTMQGKGVDVSATIQGMPYANRLELPHGYPVDTAFWIQDSLGTAAGYPTDNSTYILGHSWSQEKLVFNSLSEWALSSVDRNHSQQAPGCSGSCTVTVYPIANLQGYTVKLTTSTGTIWYKVSGAFAVAKDRYYQVDSLWAKVPNRLVLITCAVDGETSVDLDYNVVVYAEVMKTEPK